MLEFNDSDYEAKILARHYSEKLDSELFSQFVTAEVDVSSKDEAEEVIRYFWKMVDLSIDDNDNNVLIDGVEDIEFWMHKLFNKVSGYMEVHGYEDLWDELFQR